MLAFKERYPITDALDGKASNISVMPGKETYCPTVGAYGDGIISILDVDSGRELLRSWDWLLGPRCTPIATTGFGDVFLWDSTKGICFLDVQHGEKELIGDDVQWFLSDFLINPSVVSDVLRESRFRELVNRKGALKYLQAYILQPWLMLGGKDNFENYDIGHCGVYVDLVGQTHAPKM